MEREEECVVRALLALKWAKETCGGGGRLWITPTVKMELSCLPQVFIMLFVSACSHSMVISMYSLGPSTRLVI